jgi:hypothetical protein
MKYLAILTYTSGDFDDSFSQNILKRFECESNKLDVVLEQLKQGDRSEDFEYLREIIVIGENLEIVRRLYKHGSCTILPGIWHDITAKPMEGLDLLDLDNKVRKEIAEKDHAEGKVSLWIMERGGLMQEDYGVHLRDVWGNYCALVSGKKSMKEMNVPKGITTKTVSYQGDREYFMIGLDVEELTYDAIREALKEVSRLEGVEYILHEEKDVPINQVKAR